jgi:hypothetical protein
MDRRTFPGASVAAVLSRAFANGDEPVPSLLALTDGIQFPARSASPLCLGYALARRDQSMDPRRDGHRPNLGQ